MSGAVSNQHRGGDRVAALKHELREQRLLGSVRSLLSWDEETNLPSGATENRALQTALLARLQHERRIAPAFTELVTELAASSGLDEDTAVLARESFREVSQAQKLPSALVERLAFVSSQTHAAWVAARKNDDFGGVLPQLTELISLVREYGSALDSAAPYDALLDLYEPGLTAAEVERLFSELRPPLQALLDRVTTAQESSGLPEIDPSLISLLNLPNQEVLCRALAEAIGFSFEHGRLDTSHHPFCQESGPTDVRLTIRYGESEPFRAIYALLHEAGHGLYEQGFLPQYWFSPLAEACSLGMHESQSLFWENLIGRSRPFMGYLLQLCATRLSDQKGASNLAGGVDENALYRAVNRVQRSLIRVEADEVSYSLHVMVRFDLERKLISGSLAPKDLPEAWNQSYRDYIGAVAPSDQDGVLQDIHWYIGSFGYFPTYVLGRLYAAELHGAMEADIGSLDPLVAGGNFAPILSWLRTKVHRHGKRYPADVLMKSILGRPAGAAAMVKYLESKF